MRGGAWGRRQRRSLGDVLAGSPRGVGGSFCHSLAGFSLDGPTQLCHLPDTHAPAIQETFIRLSLQKGPSPGRTPHGGGAGPSIEAGAWAPRWGLGAQVWALASVGGWRPCPRALPGGGGGGEEGLRVCSRCWRRRAGGSGVGTCLVLFLTREVRKDERNLGGISLRGARSLFVLRGGRPWLRSRWVSALWPLCVGTCVRAQVVEPEDRRVESPQSWV